MYSVKHGCTSPTMAKIDATACVEHPFEIRRQHSDDRSGKRIKVESLHSILPAMTRVDRHVLSRSFIEMWPPCESW